MIVISTHQRPAILTPHGQELLARINFWVMILYSVLGLPTYVL